MTRFATKNLGSIPVGRITSAARLDADDVGRTMTVTDEGPETEVEDVPRLLKRFHLRLHAHPVTGVLTKVVVTVVGVAVILVGIVLSGPGVPGPGLLVIVGGLAILATEWTWAERLLRRARAWLERQKEKARAMDPVVRRRRIIVGLVLMVTISAAVVGYLWVYDWPGFAVSSWDRVQDISGFVPELPGM
jgi:uncharacterized protein (TIGR02611 family)